MMDIINLVKKLYNTGNLTDAELKSLIECEDNSALLEIQRLAQATAEKYYGKRVFIRGLIEFTSYCKNDCYYCGIRRSNSLAERYRLTQEQILHCCSVGYNMGFRTFVLQGGEDPYFTDDMICSIVSAIKINHADCAVTLSVGEKSFKSYKSYFESGADRYLLRQETSDCEHYGKLHPKSMSLEKRRECLYNLKKIGYQVGCGIMVGSPYQTTESIIKDLRFMQDFKPHMVGIGPFVPHRDTPFCNEKKGSTALTLRLLGIIRIMLRDVLLPATTALGTVSDNGREMGILHGANVVMPNLSPADVRGKYLLYNGKIATGAEGAEGKESLESRIAKIGYTADYSRGDHIRACSHKT